MWSKSLVQRECWRNRESFDRGCLETDWSSNMFKSTTGRVTLAMFNSNGWDFLSFRLILDRVFNYRSQCSKTQINTVVLHTRSIRPLLEVLIFLRHHSNCWFDLPSESRSEEMKALIEYYGLGYLSILPCGEKRHLTEAYNMDISSAIKPTNWRVVSKLSGEIF